MSTTSKSSLQHALCTLRAIRRRYATEHEAHSGTRFYSVQFALGPADMLWLTAAIEALEKAIADSKSEAPPHAAQLGARTNATAIVLRRAGDGQP